MSRFILISLLSFQTPFTCFPNMLDCLPCPDRVSPCQPSSKCSVWVVLIQCHFVSVPQHCFPRWALPGLLTCASYWLYYCLLPFVFVFTGPPIPWQHYHHHHVSSECKHHHVYILIISILTFSVWKSGSHHSGIQSAFKRSNFQLKFKTVQVNFKSICAHKSTK